MTSRASFRPRRDEVTAMREDDLGSGLAGVAVFGERAAEPRPVGVGAHRRHRCCDTRLRDATVGLYGPSVCGPTTWPRLGLVWPPGVI